MAITLDWIVPWAIRDCVERSSLDAISGRRLRVLGDLRSLGSHESLERTPMVTRSGAGGRMPPAVGMINESVTAMRPDLRGMAGFTVRVPKSFDIDTAEGPHCVWVQDPTMEYDESGEVSLPTVVLADRELYALHSPR